MELTSEETKVIEFIRSYGDWCDFTIERKNGKIYMMSAVEKVKVNDLHSLLVPKE